MEKKVISYRVKEEFKDEFNKLAAISAKISAFEIDSLLHEKCKRLGIMHWLEEVYEDKPKLELPAINRVRGEG